MTPAGLFRSVYFPPAELDRLILFPLFERVEVLRVFPFPPKIVLRARWCLSIPWGAP